jgi:hypothetical protein
MQHLRRVYFNVSRSFWDEPHAQARESVELLRRVFEDMGPLPTAIEGTTHSCEGQRREIVLDFDDGVREVIYV